MSRIISIHSFRGGTGKSNTTANMAALLAMDGLRVGVVDTDIQSPGIHVLFGLDTREIQYSLNDYLWGKCEIDKAAYDVNPNLEIALPGKIFLIPSSIRAGDIARVLQYGYDVNLLREGFYKLIKELELDVLMVDTHPGLNEETLLSIAISDVLVVILRPDQQDYQGTGVTIEVSRELEVPQMFLVVNKVPAMFDPAEIRIKVGETYNCEVAGILPHSDEMMSLASAGIFVLRYPDHPITRELHQITKKMLK
ncbi:MAG: MinD/ParA family protein [Desulfobacteraceae bacterium]|nr:MinD/ParA family protein [Desulfobacteraceae bacterium]